MAPSDQLHAQPFGELPFEDFRTLEELRRSDLESVPREAGVYQVLWPFENLPEFLNASPAGRFKGRDPTVPRDTLIANWIPGEHTIYIGKAGTLAGRQTLRSRLRQYLRFGQGEPVAHWGGRYIWQIERSDALVFCWHTTPGIRPRDVERSLLAQFRGQHNRLPFANLVG